MTEREKMLAGELYRPSDPGLVAARKRAKSLCARYNAAPVDHDRAALEELLGYATDARGKVWIGSGVQILPGVTIGEGTTIGAGSVVTKDIPARCVAVGNPCRVVKELN